MNNLTELLLMSRGMVNLQVSTYLCCMYLSFEWLHRSTNSNSEKPGKAATDGLAGKDTNRGMRQLSSAGHSNLLSITASKSANLIV